MTSDFCKDEIHACLKQLIILNDKNISFLRVWGLDKALATVRNTCISILTDINHPDSQVNDLSGPDQLDIREVLGLLKAVLEDFRKAIASMEELKSDEMMDQALQPQILVYQVTDFNAAFSNWQKVAAGELKGNHKSEIRCMKTCLKGWKAMTLSANEFAGLVFLVRNPEDRS